MNRLKKYLVLLFIFLLFGTACFLGLNAVIKQETTSMIHSDIDSVPSSKTVIVLGASVFSDGKLSPILKDRVDAALELFKNNKVQQFLLSGDHKTDDYNEVGAMSQYLQARGVPEDKILLDHSGFDTYDSMYRSKAVFNIKDAVVVTQEFHLPRTLFIAKNLNLNYTGYTAKPSSYEVNHQLLSREKLANFKALWEVVIEQKPATIKRKE